MRMVIVPPARSGARVMLVCKACGQRIEVGEGKAPVYADVQGPLGAAFYCEPCGQKLGGKVPAAARKE